ncbi:PASTA domain-containing protein [Actinocorallia sp. B10E7]|uniref:PASTA domain-containing protein n=1 Tax=Actinocorallia sp. B10E7 TaxID=3153558 RepID=UPI00325E8625
MGTHARRRPVTVKAVGAVAVLAAVGLSVALLGSDGESGAPDGDAVRTLAPATTSASPEESPSTELSAKVVTTPPAPSTAPASPAPVRDKTAATATPAAAPAKPAPAAGVVPGVVGLSVEQAAVKLAAAGYGHQVICQEGTPTGRVASQQPAAGQKWSPGGRVALFVPQKRCRTGRPDKPWNNH